MQAEALFETLPALCCGCWVLPLVALTVVSLISHGITAGWKNRGLEPGKLYCAGCRFDLRGASGLTCPECGSTLSNKGIMVGGDDPPAALGYQLLLVMALTTAPIIASVIVLLVALPMNYATVQSVLLRTVYPMPSDDENISIRLRIERGAWTGRIDEMSVRVYDDSFQSVGWKIDPDASAEQAYAEPEFVQRLQTLASETDDPRTQQALLDQLHAVHRALQENQGNQVMYLPGPMLVSYESNQDFSPNPLIVLVLAGLGLWLWCYLLVRTARTSAEQAEHHEQKRRAVAERYRQQVLGVVEQQEHAKEDRA